MLRKGLAGGVESGESSFEEAVKPTLERVAQRFEHYGYFCPTPENVKSV
jgi:hypothetical protein